MIRFASLFAIVSLAATSLAAHASSINPLGDGYSLSIDNTLLSSTNTSFNALTGNLSFSDATSNWLIAEVNAAPLATAVSITRTCVTLNLAGCSASTVSVTNANFLGGNLQAGVMVNAAIQAYGNVNTSNVIFAATAATGVNVAAESAIVGYSPSAPAGTSPVPEPGTLGLMATGLIGAAGTLRRRFNF